MMYNYNLQDILKYWNSFTLHSIIMYLVLSAANFMAIINILFFRDSDGEIAVFLSGNAYVNVWARIK